jgi:hypothetical protein
LNAGLRFEGFDVARVAVAPHQAVGAYDDRGQLKKYESVVVPAASPVLTTQDQTQPENALLDDQDEKKRK